MLDSEIATESWPVCCGVMVHLKDKSKVRGDF